ncbi:Dbl homology domain-containing protein [Paraphysoderma sedebokerense]|nr:Dbl homology domain-containing protein [Paraphysoderma sedebokerense]
METKPIPKANANEDDKRKYQEIREYRKSVLNWLRKTVKQCTGVEQFANLDDVDLFQSLRHGVILCKIIQCIEPSILPKIPDERPYPSIFGASLNIAEFLKACRKLGVPHDYLSKATSIVDGKQLSSLVKILTSLALIGNKSGNTPQFSQEDGQRILKIWPHGEAGMEETTEIVSPLQAQKLSYEISTLSAKIDMLDSSHRILFSRVSHVEDITESMEKKYIENTAKLDRLTAGLMDSWDHFSRKISNIEETQTAILKNLEKITEFVMRENTASVLPRKSKDGADQASSIDASTETLDSGHGGSMTDISQPPPTSPPSSPIKEPENSVSRTRQPTNSSEYSLNQSWNSSVKLSRLPAEFGALNLSRSDYLRQESIYELIETERDYVQDLSTLLSCQVADLQRYVMAPDSIKKLIGNIDEIVLVNQHFLSLLDERRKTSLIINKIGDVILQKAKSFETSYAEYSKSYPSCLQYLQQLKTQDEVRLCLEKWNTAPGIKGLSLESFLIKPIQRITKYPLIIRQIQQYTSPEHEDYSLLESALKSCEQVVEAVNQKTNMYGQMEKVIMLKSMIQGFSVSLDLCKKPPVTIFNSLSGNKRRR